MYTVKFTSARYLKNISAWEEIKRKKKIKNATNNILCKNIKSKKQ